jgi:hypothetical protein
MSTRNFRADVDHDDLQKLLSYDAETGLFLWLVGRRGSAKAGKVAGHCDKRHGYCHIAIDGKNYLGHRLAWFYVHKCWPLRFIDHIDGNPSNNAISNLREANDVQNQQNVNWRGWSEKKSHPTWTNRFEANINVNGKNVYLGRFPTAEAARAAYLAANLKYFGEFSFHRREEQSCTAL